MAHAVLLVCGSRALVSQPGAYDFCRQRMISLLGELEEKGHTKPILLRSDTIGPSSWAAELGLEMGLRVISYRLDGWRIDTHAPRSRWSSGPAPPLVRNVVMVQALTAALENGLGWGDVQFVGVLALLGLLGGSVDGEHICRLARRARHPLWAEEVPDSSPPRYPALTAANDVWAPSRR